MIWKHQIMVNILVALEQEKVAYNRTRYFDFKEPKNVSNNFWKETEFLNQTSSENKTDSLKKTSKNALKSFSSSNNKINGKFNIESEKIASKYVNGLIKVQDNNRIIFNTQVFKLFVIYF